MPLSMPMWPPVFAAPATQALPSSSATSLPVRRRWMIVDDAVRREVNESEFRAALASCKSVEVAHYPHENVITHLCYRARS